MVENITIYGIGDRTKMLGGESGLSWVAYAATGIELLAVAIIVM